METHNRPFIQLLEGVYFCRIFLNAQDFKECDLSSEPRSATIQD